MRAIWRSLTDLSLRDLDDLASSCPSTSCNEGGLPASARRFRAGIAGVAARRAPSGAGVPELAGVVPVRLVSGSVDAITDGGENPVVDIAPQAQQRIDRTFYG